MEGGFGVAGRTLSVSSFPEDLRLSTSAERRPVKSVAGAATLSDILAGRGRSPKLPSFVVPTCIESTPDPEKGVCVNHNYVCVT